MINLIDECNKVYCSGRSVPLSAVHSDKDWSWSLVFQSIQGCAMMHIVHYRRDFTLEHPCLTDRQLRQYWLFSEIVSSYKFVSTFCSAEVTFVHFSNILAASAWDTRIVNMDLAKDQAKRDAMQQAIGTISIPFELSVNITASQKRSEIS